MSSFNEYKTNSYCVGSGHYSGTTNIRRVITSNGTKMLTGSCTKCKRNKSMTISDATIEPEELKDFFKSVVKQQLTLEKNAYNPVSALEIASKIEGAAASRNPRDALSATPDLIKFATTGEGTKVVQKGSWLYLGTKKI